MNGIPIGEPANQILLVQRNPSDQITGDTDIKGTIPATGQNIHGRSFLHHHNSHSVILDGVSLGERRSGIQDRSVEDTIYNEASSTSLMLDPGALSSFALAWPG